MQPVTLSSPTPGTSSVLQVPTWVPHHSGTIPIMRHIYFTIHRREIHSFRPCLFIPISYEVGFVRLIDFLPRYFCSSFGGSSEVAASAFHFTRVLREGHEYCPRVLCERLEAQFSDPRLSPHFIIHRVKWSSKERMCPCEKNKEQFSNSLLNSLYGCETVCLTKGRT
jgi:hypothetical protein